MLEPPVLVAQHGSVVRLVLNRPDQHNALNTQMWELLGQALSEIDGRPGVGAVVLAGAGRTAFSVGLDLHELAAMEVAEAERALRIVEETLLRLESLPVPTVAAVRGWAMGSGAELAMACDLRICADDARFGLPIARLGIMVSSQLLQRFVDALGMGLTKELLYTGRHLEAREAFERGLVNRVVEADALDAATDALLDQVSLSSMAALRAAKRSLALCQPLTVAYGTQTGAPYFFDPDDFREGLAAFLERRRPRFAGRSDS